MTDLYKGWLDWSGYSVPELAEILDEDLSVAWGQAHAWQETHDLVAQHRVMLERARVSLASAWPPERSPAAALFFEFMDSLIASMGEMQDVAVTNQGALSGVLSSLEQTRTTVDELHEQWRAAGSGGKMQGPHPQQTDGQKALNKQAQEQMRTTDNDVLTSGNRLAAPTPYGPPGAVDPQATSVSTDDDLGQGRARRSGSMPRLTAPTIPSVSSPASALRSDAGPTLSGGPHGDQNIGHPGLGAAGGSLDPRGMTGSQQIDHAFPPAVPSAGSWFVTTPGGRALRAGAVIGDPSHGVPVPSEDDQRSARSGLGGFDEDASGRRPNPVGGLLGGPVSSAGDRERRRRRAMPLDTEWEVRRGVPPILAPGSEPHHDPGPGVIGIDR
jgi:hypothetical protein